ncbi:MAG: hypothetical protein WBD25_21975, partial [Terriglobales bacterium]
MPDVQRDFPRLRIRLALAVGMAIVLLAGPGLAQNQPSVSLETSETLFTVLTAINTCGYDQELSVSDPLREQIRSEVAKAIENTAGSQDVVTPMCTLYRRHQI